MSLHHILAINPGSTSTKVAVYVNAKVVFLKSIPHDIAELNKHINIADQFEIQERYNPGGIKKCAYRTG